MSSISNDETFSDDIHDLMNGIGRPKKTKDITALKDLLSKIVQQSSTDISHWKLFVLALVYKRYHLKAPEAKRLAKEDKKSPASTGDGERLIFYEAIQHLFEHVVEGKDGVEFVAKALNCLLDICPSAGGSRDVCAVIERMTAVVLMKQKEYRARTIMLYEKESLSDLVRHGVNLYQELGGEAKVAMEKMLQLAAKTLDADKQMILHGDDEVVPSTLHVFIPHRDRGRPSVYSNRRRHLPKTTNFHDRQLVNSVAEVLIWARTNLMSNKAFAASYKGLLQSCTSNTSRETVGKAKVHLRTLQTIIRNERKLYNSFARKRGFMLANLMQLDSHSISFRQIQRGKAGDINELSRLAKKRCSDRVLRLVNLRFASNPSKITRFESLSELVRSWSPPSKTADEIEKLTHDHQLLRLKATVRFLRSLAEPIEGTLVASLDDARPNNVGALLIASAMSTWKLDDDDDDCPVVGCRLHSLGAIHEVDSFDVFIGLLNGFVTQSMEVTTAPSLTDDAGNATTKAVINLIDRHLAPGQALVVFCNQDVVLPTAVMEKLTSQDSSIHCHDTDDIGQRLSREGAKQGDMTISLAWDTHDDLDLHVFLPCNEEVSYNRREVNDAVLDVDMNACSPLSMVPVENVFVGDLEKKQEATRGTYKVVVENYSYHTQGATQDTPIAWRVVVDKNGQKTNYNGRCVGTKSRCVACEFEYEGRTIPFPADEAAVSALNDANVVNVTASKGQTLESLSQVVQTVRQHEHMDHVRQLLDDDEGGDTIQTQRPIVSEEGKYEVTSRERNNILLFNLPTKFHAVVNEVFGGGRSLEEQCAEGIAKHMVESSIPLSELKKAGYPEDIVESVKTMMTKVRQDVMS